jgi:hypothetical protein
MTGDPPARVRRATTFLARAEELLLPGVIIAEVVYVLESFYEVEHQHVAERRPRDSRHIASAFSPPHEQIHVLTLRV